MWGTSDEIFCERGVVLKFCFRLNVAMVTLYSHTRRLCHTTRTERLVVIHSSHKMGQIRHFDPHKQTCVEACL